MVMMLGANSKLRLRRRVFAITLGLLIAQLGMLAHALEHERELAQARPHAACFLCHAADHLGHGLPASFALATIPRGPVRAALEFRVAADVQTVFPFLARAPPAALQAQFSKPLIDRRGPCQALGRGMPVRHTMEACMDSAFFSDQIIGSLDAQGVEYTVSVPFERFTEIKKQIERRRRWNLCNWRVD